MSSLLASLPFTSAEEVYALVGARSHAEALLALEFLVGQSERELEYDITPSAAAECELLIAWGQQAHAYLISLEKEVTFMYSTRDLRLATLAIYGTRDYWNWDYYRLLWHQKRRFQRHHPTSVYKEPGWSLRWFHPRTRRYCPFFPLQEER